MKLKMAIVFLKNKIPYTVKQSPSTIYLGTNGKVLYLLINCVDSHKMFTICLMQADDLLMHKM